MFRTTNYLLGLLLLCLLAAPGRAETVRIYHVGVGQGDGTLIVVTNDLRQKASILIDAGNGKTKGAAMLAMIKTYLSDVQRVDVIITSHLHSDHLGGMQNVVSTLVSNNWGIGTILDRSAQGYIGDDSCYTENDANLIDRLNDDTPQLPTSQLVKAYAKLVAPLRDKGALNWFNVAAGINVFATFIPKFQTRAQLRCLTSNGYVCKTATDYSDWINLAGEGRNENDFSYSFLFELNSFKYFTGGDIGGGKPYVDLETPLVAFFGTRPDAGTFHFCAYKASHHGSLHSTNAAFVAATTPTLTVVPSALRSFSGTKLPGEATLTRLDGVNSNLRYTYIWATNGGSSRSSGSVTAYRDVTIIVHDTAYEANHQMMVCSITRDKATLALLPNTLVRETITCPKHANTLLARQVVEADRLAFEKAVSAPLPAAGIAPPPTPAPALRTSSPRRHQHFWPWRWGHRHAYTE
ncbi:MBL fold metallo-hydrolase [Hymenobacter terricola]|uniref:MBL fold metallo-hydrolase n=1 Tax=Hymenobacter terricola TaxID=2819236 RepID=UPI001B311C96|nr:MBL fold metallo-hydrolase [Hymenobacter terricola]